MTLKTQISEIWLPAPSSLGLICRTTGRQTGNRSLFHSRGGSIMPATSRKRSTGGRKTTRRQTGTNNRSGIDAISLLTKDHGTVRQLLKRLESSAENGRGTSSELLRQIENELKIH